MSSSGFGNWFKQVEDAKANVGGVYIEPGLYLAEIEALKMIRTQSGVDAFIVELAILKSNCDTRKAGTSMSWYVGFDKKSAPGNVKAFFEALFPGEVIDTAGMEQAVSDANPCKGMIVHIEGTQIKTKAGNPFTKCVFRLATDAEKAAVGIAA